MGTTTEELKKLYAKLGGTDPNIPKASTPGEVINGINELELGGDKLPEVTEADNGKALGVKQGKWDKMDVDIELPDVTTDDNGKVLMVSDGNWGKDDLPKELPSVSSTDNGNVLTVVEGAWAKAAISGNVVIINATNSGTYITLDRTPSEVEALLAAGKIVFVKIANDRILWFDNVIHYIYGIKRNNLGNLDMLLYETYNGKKYIYVDGYMFPRSLRRDSGKVMTVSPTGEWSVAAIPSQLPAVTASDNGKILKVVDGVWTAVDPDA